ncbi:glycosyltransferase family 4 protein [Guyparkeria halophila]|uniref:Glycosyltransferase family 4 protein n=1 Tax=Guyparkeria halophila TaxID=47960 RepID=A0ABZ0YYE2_9GAMM|nr:glycosyltransferase family 4 protein [Guyparkeria halophila]WQH16267.1 glycosyltransferase family 4 protein [Guyparkeria halophila]
METLTWHMVDELKHAYRVTVIGPTGASSEAPEGIDVVEAPPAPLPWFLLRAFVLSIWTSLKLRPASVIAANGLTAPSAWICSKLVSARSAVYLHGLDIKTKNPVYRAIWLPFIRRCDVVIANSRFIADVATRSGVNPSRIRVLNPGVSLPEPDEHAPVESRFRAAYQLGSHPLMLYVGRFTKGKGLLPFVENVLPAVIKEMPNAKLVVIGGAATKGLGGATNYAEQVEEAVARNHLVDNVVFCGEKKYRDPDISAAYFSANVLVFAAQNDDEVEIEGFGMVPLEAAAHGLPTVGFGVGGLLDSVAPGSCGLLVEPGDYMEFTLRVLEALRMKDSVLTQSCVQFAQQRSWKQFGIGLRSILTK